MLPDDPSPELETAEKEDFAALLDYLKRSRGFDFSGYKRPGLLRRMNKRIQMLGLKSFDAYHDYLEVHPEEFTLLFNALLINVTSFFRDPAAWDYLATQVLPNLLAAKAPQTVFRIWSAGCAAGQEAYTLIMMMGEILGLPALMERVKVYATDIDEEALAQARQGSYPEREVAGIPPPLLEKYFERSGDRYLFDRNLRRLVIFGHLDLLQDAPISHLDLLVCRNTLMYFNAENQSRILSRFHFALNDTGSLFLGKAEMLFSRSDLFLPQDLKQRFFTKATSPVIQDRLRVMTGSGLGDHNGTDNGLEIRKVIFDGGSMAQVVVDYKGFVSLVNEEARSLFRLTAQDLGRPFQDLEISYNPVELRSCLEQAYRERVPVGRRNIQWPGRSGETASLDVMVVPLMDVHGNLLGANITFADVTRFKKLQEDLEYSNRALETAYEELQSVNEELETTNEEMQSTLEELETTNEEMQSTNEELETMNEELQSTNEELYTLNDELRLRSEEVDHANAFVLSVLASLRGGVVVIDKDMKVEIWNPHAEDLWGLRAEEVLGRYLLNLDIGLPVEQLRLPIRDCLQGDTPPQEIILDARNRRGQPIRCRVVCTALTQPGSQPQGAILVMDVIDNTAT